MRLLKSGESHIFCFILLIKNLTECPGYARYRDHEELKGWTGADREKRCHVSRRVGALGKVHDKVMDSTGERSTDLPLEGVTNL